MKRTDRPDPPQPGLAFGARAGPPLERVRSDWFVPLGECERAHWFDRGKVGNRPTLIRLCDGHGFAPADLLEPGDWPSCKRCTASIKGRPK